jgi:hypothetical protein
MVRITITHLALRVSTGVDLKEYHKKHRRVHKTNRTYNSVHVKIQIVEFCAIRIGCRHVHWNGDICAILSGYLGLFFLGDRVDLKFEVYVRFCTR